MYSKLSQLGWDDDLANTWKQAELDVHTPGRIIADYGQTYKVAIPDEITADISGRVDYLSESHEKPKIGDWVSIQLLDDQHGIIHDVLPRKSEISRKQSGNKLEKQVLAANVDIAFLVQALDDDFSPERLRRYIFQLRKEDIIPIIVLNKSDKANDLTSQLNEVEALKVEILVTSALENKGIDEIANHIPLHKTAVFLGSSGVGKSTITNRLLGVEKQDTGAIRENDSKGRHTTTHRELFLLPEGGLIIDTPGLRELQLWGAESDLESTFPEIEILSKNCKFSNCTHGSESACAIKYAIQTGKLDPTQLESFFKFQKELRYLKTKVDVDAAIKRKKGNKTIQKSYRQIMKTRKRHTT